MKYIITIIFICSIVICQGWEKTYNFKDFDWGSYAIETYDGGYVIAGETYPWNSFGGAIAKALVVKTDANGDTIWSRIYGDGLKAIDIYYITLTSDSNLLLVGEAAESLASPAPDVLLMKIDIFNGELIWTHLYGVSSDISNPFDVGYSATNTPDRGYVVVGWTQDPLLPAFSEIYIIRTDSLGDSIWTREYYFDIINEGYSVITTNDSSFIVAGYTGPSYNQQNIFLMKIDSNGDVLWQHIYNNRPVDLAYSVIGTFDNGFLIVGCTGDLSIGLEFDFYLIRTDSIGDTVWTRTFDNRLTDIAYSVSQTWDYGFTVVGVSYPWIGDSSDTYLIKVDQNGNLVWEKVLGNPSFYDEGRSVNQTIDSGFIIGGTISHCSTDSGWIWADFYLIKTDSLGRIDTTFIFETPLNKPNILELSVFPNPFNSSVRISIDAPVGAHGCAPLQIEIFDITGKRIFTESVGATHASPANKTDKACLAPTEFIWSPAPDLPSGIYLVRAKIGTQTFEKRAVYLK